MRTVLEARILTLASIILLAGFMTACDVNVDLPVSLYPLYTAEDLIFDQDLLGSWKVDNATWTFMQAGEKEYTLQITDSDGSSSDFEARLAQIASYQFLDIYYAKDQLAPVHLFLQLRMNGDVRELGWLNGPDGRWDVAHVRREKESTVITAPTREIQAFILSRMKAGDLFEDWSEMCRQE